MSSRNPEPAYPAKDSAVLYGDKDLYGRIQTAAASGKGLKLVETFEVPTRSGKAWSVKKGRCAILHIKLLL